MSIHSTEFKFNFVPGWRYAVRVLVDTSRGSADTDYNLDIRQTEVQIACLTEATYGKLNLFEEDVTMNRITVGGVNSATCKGPSINFSVKEAVTQTPVMQQGSHGHQLWADGLTPNTTYVFSVNSASLIVTTLPRPPTAPQLSLRPSATTADVTWTSQRAERFNVSWVRTRRGGCRDKQHENVRQFLSLYEPRVQLTQLEAYTEYEVCVLAFNRGGSSETCGALLTLPNSAPTLPVTELECLYNECSVHVGDGCSQYNGPNLTLVWTFSAAPACNTSARHSLRFEDKLYNFGTKSFDADNLNLLPGITYTLSVSVKNDYGEGQPVHTTYASPNDTVPGPVEELTSTATSTSVSLRWRRPCPPKAPILSYRVTADGVELIRQYYSKSKCLGNAAHFCRTFTGLKADQTYKFEVQSCRRSYYKDCSAAETISVRTQETVAAPEPPTMTLKRWPKGLSISFTSSWAITKQCFIETFHGVDLISNNTYDIINNWQHINVSMDDLLPSSVYDFSSWCCNHVGCSLRTNASEATEFEAPVVRDRLQVVSIYDTNATLRLPTVEAGDAQTNFTIMVHNISAGLEGVNFTAEFHKWRRANHMQINRRRRSSRPGCAENAPVFIAGHVAKGTSEFVLGSGESAPGTSNCPLIKGNAYGVAVMMSARLKHEEEFVLEKLDRPIIAGGSGGMAAGATVGIAIGVLVILALVIGLLVSSFQRRKKLRRLQVPVRPPVPDTLPLHLYDDFYDFRDGWVPADDLPVSMANIETFLNKSIGSLYMKHKFSSIPVNRDKPTRAAALAGNLKKNRYGNNLPYDDTRVHLLEIDDYAAYINPHSDYINASHITGAVPHRRYIAAQGTPKVCWCGLNNSSVGMQI
ncbi:receptor-type tyrosine-protein phosphatase delta-like [Hyalella azteca]|uniref:Receptor-type tyrosine-protein phosphatase delta-like n=1 Tax=Hyalella azteca TaxID=294128 RepID=A0A979FUA4_HYAAZ|nr:receptor-type tyrosine-protein phosphatase delta-like [Hyalella azteca]